MSAGKGIEDRVIKKELKFSDGFQTCFTKKVFRLDLPERNGVVIKPSDCSKHVFSI